MVTDFVNGCVVPEAKWYVTIAVAVAEFPLLLEVTFLIVQADAYEIALGVQLMHFEVVPS